MEEKKYELSKDDAISFENVILYRIKALKDFGDVRKGQLGGYIESENNLSHSGDCWIYPYSKVFGNVRIIHNAKVSGDAVLCGSFIVGNTYEVSDHPIYDKMVKPEISNYDIHTYITNLLLDIGISSKFKGFSYIREGILINKMNIYGDLRITKDLYPNISKKFGVSPTSVERNIRYAIRNSNKEKFESFFHCSSKEITNSEFIAYIIRNIHLDFNC